MMPQEPRKHCCARVYDYAFPICQSLGTPSVIAASISTVFFNKLTTIGIPLHFLLVLCEYKGAPVVLDDPPLGAKDVLILN